ncbi:inclusion body protein [Janthinobacterium sp. HH104]|uniref:Inclusion body protein n=2 Tax=Janthinobacterium TaxID=29580 RepID=A0AB38C3Q6_9BURK|nr:MULTISPECIES: inclusion body family protein [Janthinobacterium]EZP36343.1 inclusion body protein [Janthinobacterium lividum]MBW3497238.1 inclusion body family protein [Janthinobacterium sp. NKUCC08_JDC]MDX8121318.1 inclusion body family protein [Janthinobacterium sp. GMG2]OEZ79583.1 inclusion body protein [Janthinobacterium sp. HH104]SFX17377.1 Inclusion body protein [Janthinobacterium lividum]
MTDAQLYASNITINILVVIDTDLIMAQHPRQTSPDQTKPVGLVHTSQYMIATDLRGINSGQGTADLSFKANVGDFVSFTGASIYDNADSAVIVYGINYWNGDKVFNTFVSNTITRRNAAVPNTDSSNGLPAVQQSRNFSNFTAQVSKSGTENFYVYIAVYSLNDDGQTQSLYGYFYWDPQITVG